MTYIYRITNNINGKTYIGQHHTNNLNDGYMGSGTLLQKAKDKYGLKNFTKEILVLTYSEKQNIIDTQERYYIFKERRLKGRENVYNISDGGSGASGPMSEEHKRKIGLANKGKCLGPMSEEMKQKLSKASKGKKRVICIETGIIYESETSVRKTLGIRHVGEVCAGHRKSAGKLHWKYI